jgi:hypothetical protein
MAVVLTNIGKSILASRLIDLLSAPQYLGVGVGAGSAAATDMTLFSETGSRVLCTVSLHTVDTANDTARINAVWTNFGLPLVITNLGLFDAPSGGNLFIKADSVGQALDTNEGLTVVADVKITGACP